MIQSLEVNGLNGRFNYALEFHDDLNIIIGPNGSGKTTLLKLIWYLTSGNLHRIIPEISLTSVKIKTIQFELSLRPVNDEISVEWKFDGKEQKSTTLAREEKNIDSLKKHLYSLNEEVAKIMPGSLFFSNFGKLEGNYTAEPTMGLLQMALSHFSEALSVGHHRFMPAVSTYDITELLTQKDLAIHGDTDSDNDERAMFVERWTFLDQLVKDIYEEKYDGIRIVEDIILGGNHRTEDGDFISLNNLSSGERRILGFLCYNAFSEARTIFINEPASNLDPDWQKLILRLLTYQGTEKQFFFTTRSHHISTFFREKELVLRND